ncbi:DUF4407 domain-containing protein [Streptomyces sp. MS2A]|nr:DUF4407 domain-containing protein [Streptomyces sp. MS2A]
MSYSAHRPGRLDSQGRIALDASAADGAPTRPEEQLEFVREYVPAGSENVPPRPADPVSPDAETAVLAEPQPAVAAEPPASVSRAADESTPAPAAEPAPAPAARTRRERRPRTPGSIWRRLAILGGADGPILDRVPSETSRFVQMFFVLVGTALVSALSMFFALVTGVQVIAWIAIPLAIVWALIIFNLDRFLTSTMTSTRSVWRLIGLAFPRVIMAALIGFVVAEPVVLQVFHNDIAREVASTNITQSLSDQEALEKGPEKKALDDASARLKDLENQAATGIVAGTSSDSASQTAAQATVDQLNAQMAEQQKVIDQARLLYQCELTGEGAGTVPGCTGVNGEGASSDAARAQLDQAQQTYDGLAAQLRTANDELAAASTASKENTTASEAQNRTEAQDQLPAARQTYETALAAYNARAASVADGNAGAIGLLSQISGLNRLGEKEPTIFWAHWLIAALFFMIELLPVLVKVLTSYGDPSLYEKAAAVAKQVELDRVNSHGFRERAAIISEDAARREDPGPTPTGTAVSDPAPVVSAAAGDPSASPSPADGDTAPETREHALVGA